MFSGRRRLRVPSDAWTDRAPNAQIKGRVQSWHLEQAALEGCQGIFYRMQNLAVQIALPSSDQRADSKLPAWQEVPPWGQTLSRDAGKCLLVSEQLRDSMQHWHVCAKHQSKGDKLKMKPGQKRTELQAKQSNRTARSITQHQRRFFEVRSELSKWKPSKEDLYIAKK